MPKTATNGIDDTDYTKYKNSVLIKLRIDYLLDMLNSDTINRKQRKQIKTELFGYGIIPLRVQMHHRTIEILTDDGLTYDQFIINGIMPMTDGDDIIGFYCPACKSAISVLNMDVLVVRDYVHNIVECAQCTAQNIREIKLHNIKQRT